MPPILAVIELEAKFFYLSFRCASWHINRFPARTLVASNALFPSVTW
jgi:hypothetical protein